jgi:hypothetical protein
MHTTRRHLASLSVIVGLVITPLAAHAQNYPDPNFANSVVSSSGLGTNPLYNDPNAALGQPSTQIYGGYDIPQGEYHVSMVYAPYYTTQQTGGQDVIVSMGTAGTETVKFDTPIVHSDQHWYGDDFILFGNTFFSGSASVTPTTNMATDIIGSGGIYQNGAPQISVSSDGVTFYSITPNSPYYPTNPYQWVGVSAQNPSGWNDSSLNDFTKPVNPALVQPGDTSLSVAAFAGKSVAYAANTLYNGSAGGAAFSLAGLVDANGNPITSISYIRFTGDPTNSGDTTNIDAISRVGFASAPEPSGSAILLVGVTGLVMLAVRRQKSQVRQA